VKLPCALAQRPRTFLPFFLALATEATAWPLPKSAALAVFPFVDFEQCAKSPPTSVAVVLPLFLL